MATLSNPCVFVSAVTPTLPPRVAICDCIPRKRSMIGDHPLGALVERRNTPGLGANHLPF